MEIQDIFRQMQAEENRFYAKKTGLIHTVQGFHLLSTRSEVRISKNTSPSLSTHHLVTHTEIGFMKVLFHIMQIIFLFKNQSILFHLHAICLQLVK